MAMQSSHHFPLIFLILTITLTSTTAEIKHLNLTSDSRPLFLFEKFGFQINGVTNIEISEATFSSSVSSPDPSSLGFLLLPASNLLRVLQNPDPDFCILSSPYIRLLFTLRDLTPPPFNSYNKSFSVSFPGDYSLIFANCVPESEVSMSLTITMYNHFPDGSFDYLSVGDSLLPVTFFAFALIYIAFVLVWSRLSLTHRIHYLMGALLAAKILNLLFHAEEKHYVRVTGTPHGWDVLFYLFQFIRGALLLVVVVLIGTGWSILKPYLQSREKKILAIVIPLQCVASIGSIVIGEKGPFIQDWATWVQVFILVDVVCCCAILFPIVWSIKALRETIGDGKAARNLAKLVAFRRLYIGLIGYLYFTRVVVYVLRMVLSYKYRWVSVAVEEGVTLAFYALMFYMFRPKDKNEHLRSSLKEEEAAMVALKDEGFDI